MSSKINAAFKSLEDNLQDVAITNALQVNSILKEFDVAKEPEEDQTPGLLKNIALGKLKVLR